MSVDLARFAGSARQDLDVHVNFTWIPAQAVEQVIQFRMTPIFITGLQGWESWPGTGNFMHLSFLSASFLLSHSHPLIWGEQRKKTSGTSIAYVLGYFKEKCWSWKFSSLVLLLLKIFQPPVPRKRKAFGGIVCNAGKPAHVKNCSEILIPLQQNLSLWMTRLLLYVLAV